MNPRRWIEVERDIGAAVQHFAGAVRLFNDPALRAGGWEGYKTRMSLMHTMQAGHTSLEAALLRILDMHEEVRPIGEFWHTDLIRRVAQAIGDRPVIRRQNLPTPRTAPSASVTSRCERMTSLIRTKRKMRSRRPSFSPIV